MRSAIIVTVCVIIFGGVFFAVQKKRPETNKSEDVNSSRSVNKESPSKEKVIGGTSNSVSKTSSKAEDSKIEIVKAKVPWTSEKEELDAKEKWLLEYKEKVLEAIRLTQTTEEDKKAIKGHINWKLKYLRFIIVNLDTLDIGHLFFKEDHNIL